MEERNNSEGTGGKWMPGEMLRGKIRRAAKQQQKIQRERRERVGAECGGRTEVGDRENLNYSADSHNTRTWPRQLSGSSRGEISFFHSSLWGTFTALREKPAH